MIDKEKRIWYVPHLISSQSDINCEQQDIPGIARMAQA